MSLLLTQQLALAHGVGHLGTFGAANRAALPEALATVTTGEQGDPADAAMQLCTLCLALVGVDAAPPSLALPWSPPLAAQGVLATSVPPAPTFRALVYFRSRAPPLLPTS